MVVCTLTGRTQGVRQPRCNTPMRFHPFLSRWMCRDFFRFCCAMADTPEATIQLLYDLFGQGKVQELLDVCCAGELSLDATCIYPGLLPSHP